VVDCQAVVDPVHEQETVRFRRAMFFLKQLKHPIRLHPSYFGPSTLNFIQEKLYSDVEGTCTGEDGYIISVLDISGTGLGTIEPGTGQAEFIVQYSAIVFRPFKNEVLDAVVNNVGKMGIFVSAGPLTIFVSAHLAGEFKFDANANPPCFSREGTNAILDKIQVGSRLRLKIVGTRIDATEIFAIGSIMEDYLGPRLPQN